MDKGNSVARRKGVVEEKKRLQSGIPLPKYILSTLLELAESAKIPFPHPINRKDT